MVNVSRNTKALFALGMLLFTAHALAETVVTTTVTTINYDDYGNPVSTISETTANEPAGTRFYRQTTLNSYSLMTGSDWLPGRLTCTLVATETPAEGSLVSTDLLKISSSFNVYFSDAPRLHKVQTTTSGPVSASGAPSVCTVPDSLHSLLATYDYNTQGQLTSVTHGTGTDARMTSFVYADGNRRVTTTNPLTYASTAVVTAFGKNVENTDANLYKTKYTYDVLSRPITIVEDNFTPESVQYQTCSGSGVCETNELLFAVSTTVLAGPGTPIKAPVTRYLDRLGRTIRTVTKGFDDRYLISKNAFNTKGELVQKTLPYLSPVQNGEQIRTVTLAYDNAGRLKSTTQDQSGRIEQVNYLSAFDTEYVNAKGQKRKERRDGIGRTRKITDNLGFSQQYFYDAAGKLRFSTDPKGNVTQITYGPRGDRNSFIDPDMGTWSYESDIFGNVKKETDSKSQVKTYEYDKLNRLTRRLEPDQDNWFEYDGPKGKGKLARTYLKRSDGSRDALHEFYYDDFSRLSQEFVDISTSQSSQYRSCVYGYGVDGRLQTVSYSSAIPGREFSYKHVYDQNGYLTELRDTNSNELYWQALSRDADGRVLRSKLGTSGIYSERKLKPDSGDLDTVLTGTLLDAGNPGSAIIGSVQNDSYGFDAAGNLTVRNQNAGPTSISETFGYDAGNRLVSATVSGQPAKTLRYDEVGNIAWKSDVGNYHYGQAVNMLDPAFVPGPSGGQPSVLGVNAAVAGCTGIHRVCSTDGGSLATALTYDSNGNVLTGNNRTYRDYADQTAWMSFNHPFKIERSSGATDLFYYDANHQRRAHHVFNTLGQMLSDTRFVHLSGGRVYEERPEQRFTYPLMAEGRVVANVVATQSGSTLSWSTHYPHSDNQGSVAAVTDQAGAVLERYSYDVWGKRRNLDGSDNTAGTLASTVTPRGYTGHQMLDNQGLIHMGARLYDPQLARFVSADPTIDGAGSIQGFNRYAYVHNNPATLMDPTGYGACYEGVGCVEMTLKSADTKITVTSRQDGSSLQFVSQTRSTTSSTGSSSTSQTGTVQYQTVVYSFSPNAPAWANAPYLRAVEAFDQYQQQMQFFNEVYRLMASGRLPMCSGFDCDFSSNGSGYSGPMIGMGDDDIDGIDGRGGAYGYPTPKAILDAIDPTGTIQKVSQYVASHLNVNVGAAYGSGGSVNINLGDSKKNYEYVMGVGKFGGITWNENLMGGPIPHGPYTGVSQLCMGAVIAGCLMPALGADSRFHLDFSFGVGVGVLYKTVSPGWQE